MSTTARQQSAPVHDEARLARARGGVFALFFVMGVMLASFLGRLPSVRDQLGVTEGGLARLLAVGAIGALTALMLTGWAAARWGTRRLLVWSTFGYASGLALLALATSQGSPWLFAVGQFWVTFNFAFTNVPMNAEAAEVERRMGRSILPRFHAAFSIGMAAGLAAAATLSHAGVSAAWHWLGAAAVATAVRLAVINAAVLDGAPRDTGGAKLGGPLAVARQEYREPQVLLLGVIVFAASMTEMSAGQWIGISVVDDFGQTEAVGDLSYWVFVAAMVAVRWLGTPIIDRLGRVAVVRVSALSVAAGLLVYALAPSHLWALPGLVLWGLGAALVIPIGFSAASDLHERAAARVAAVSSFATIAGLIGPQVVGHLAETHTTRMALLVILLFSLASFLAAPSARRREP